MAKPDVIKVYYGVDNAENDSVIIYVFELYDKRKDGKAPRMGKFFTMVTQSTRTLSSIRTARYTGTFTRRWSP